MLLHSTLQRQEFISRHVLVNHHFACCGKSYRLAGVIGDMNEIKVPYVLLLTEKLEKLLSRLWLVGFCLSVSILETTTPGTLKIQMPHMPIRVTGIMTL